MNDSRPSAILATAALGLAVLVLPARAETPTVRYYHGHAQVLDRDTTRLAVFVDPDDPSADPVAILAAQGLEGRVTAPMRPGWWMVDVGGRPDDLERALASGMAFVSPVFDDFRGGSMNATPSIMVRFLPEVDDPAARAIMAQLAPGAELGERGWGGMSGAYRIRSASRNGFDVIDQANALALHPATRWAEVDWLFPVYPDVIPAEPAFDTCWQHFNPADSYTGTCLGWPTPDGILDRDMDSTDAWDFTMGDPSVVVAIFDNGIAQSHPDINQLPGYDFVNSGGDGGPWNACDGHGTFVAGCISAMLNGSGVVGVAPQCPSVSMKIWNDGGGGACSGSGVLWSSVIDGLEIAETIGVRVTNHSYGAGPQSNALEDKLKLTRSNGMVHFASSGNGDANSIGQPNIGYPASIRWVNAVGALNPDGSLAGFSNYGMSGTLWPEEESLFLCAPGVLVGTTVGNSGSGLFCGTSASSPCAAGVAALVISLVPNLPSAGVEIAMALGAQDLGAIGYDESFGYGFVNAHGAITSALENEFGDSCGSVNDGDCFQSNGSPGCQYQNCCLLVCSNDPFCCEVAWDTLCVVQAIDLCLGCPGEEPCDVVHNSPGCNDPDCCANVCQIDPLCCALQWDNPCVGVAIEVCGLAPANDSCANPASIGNGTTPFSVTNASNDGVTHEECNWITNNDQGIVVTKDVWFKYAAECTGYLKVSTCGQAGFQTWIAVYDAGPCPPSFFDLLGCATDTPGCANKTATLDGIYVQTGETYMIRIGALTPTVGSGTLTVSCSPLFDDCADALFIDDFTGSLNIDTNGATTDGPAHPGCGTPQSSLIEADVWYDWVAPCTGDAIVATCGTVDFDSWIAVYEGWDCTSTILLACNNDFPLCFGPPTDSLVAFEVQAGEPYKIRLGGYGGATGAGQMTIACTPNGVPGDLNGDGVVDGGDLGILLAQWGPCSGCPADLNGDGSVDGEDLGLLLGYWS
ncbi:MAG: S8 family serine peptidase [Phycisphaerales bacterium]|nr:S8 family serine peptidase [Phycisphaerales bacterium]